MVTLPLCIDYLVSESHALLNYKYCNTCVSCAAIISTLYSRNIHVAESVMYSCRICRIHTHPHTIRVRKGDVMKCSISLPLLCESFFLLLCHVFSRMHEWNVTLCRSPSQHCPMSTNDPATEVGSVLTGSRVQNESRNIYVQCASRTLDIFYCCQAPLCR